MEDTATVKALVKDEGITHIVHLAAVLIPFCQQQPVSGAMVNVIGTLNLFEAARDAGRPVRVVYASSAAVWGPEEAYGTQALTEDEALKPATHYGVFKQANEGNARVFFSLNGISSVGLRPWTVYGVGRDQGMTADPTLAIRALVNGEKFQMRLTGFMDLQYVADVADTFIECLLSPLEGATYSIWPARSSTWMLFWTSFEVSMEGIGFDYRVRTPGTCRLSHGRLAIAREDSGTFIRHRFSTESPRLTSDSVV